MLRLIAMTMCHVVLRMCVYIVVGITVKWVVLHLLNHKNKRPTCYSFGGLGNRISKIPFPRLTHFLWYMGSNCVIYSLRKPWNFTGPMSYLSTDSTGLGQVWFDFIYCKSEAPPIGGTKNNTLQTTGNCCERWKTTIKLFYIYRYTRKTSFVTSVLPSALHPK